MAHFWAHAPRKLKEVFDRDSSEIAAEGLRRIAEFYAIETDSRGISPSQRLSARHSLTAPLVSAFGDLLQAQRRKISAKSRLGEKLTYIHNHWDDLQTFLTDGRVEIDSNRVENLISPIALNRKNASTSCCYGTSRRQAELNVLSCERLQLFVRCHRFFIRPSRD